MHKPSTSIIVFFTEMLSTSETIFGGKSI